MEWIDDLHDQTVALDTAILIYFIEENPLYFSLIRPLFQAIDSGQIRAVTSTITLLEVLVHPLREGNLSLANRYRDILLHSDGLETLPLEHSLSELAAELRARYQLRVPDAIQIATALKQQATTIITNDTRWRRVTDLNVVIMEDLVNA